MPIGFYFARSSADDQGHDAAQAERYRLVTRSDFDGLVCAALLKQLGILDDILFVHPKDVQDGKVELGARRHHDEPAVQPGRRALVRPPPARRPSASREHAEQPRDRRRAPTRPRAWSTTTSAARSASRGIEELMDAVDKADAAQFTLERDPRSRRLGPAQLPDGPAHRPRPLPRVPDLQLPADDAADRRLHDACRSTRSSSTPDVAERVDALPRARRGRRGADPPLRDRARQPRGARPPRRGGHPPDQPLHALRAVPAVQHLDPRALGPAPAEHRVRDRQVDPRPLVARRTSAS